MQVVLRIGEVPLRDDDVALLALRPWGFAAGSSPAAMRSVQSAYSFSARGVSIRPMAVAMLVMACPERMRRAQASSGFMSENIAGIVRVALLPSAWQPKQPLVLVTLSHSVWVLTLPSGNSFAAGVFSIAYQ